MKLLDKDQCCGCGACAYVCPVHAIDMIKDNEGYPYPSVDEKKCTNCGLCEKICFWKKGQQSKTMSYDSNKVYAFQAESKIREKSQSGGAFYQLASFFLKTGGVVYGCILNDKKEAVIARGTCTAEIEKMRGSKYVWSNMQNVYELILEDLESGRNVLFAGLTCQSNQIRFMYGKYDNLYTVDLICHGGTSPLVFEEYCKWQEKRHSASIKTINFRNKRYGWRSHIETLFLENGKNFSDDVWASIFYSHLCMRPSCYECNKTIHLTDITIGDCWTSQKNLKRGFDNKGTSIILVHSTQGSNLFEQIQGSRKKLDLSVYMQPHLLKPVEKPQNRDIFWVEFNNGFDKVLLKFGWISTYKRMRTKIKKIYYFLFKG